MNRAGHLIMVRVVLTTISIYSMMAMDLPKWVIKTLEKKKKWFSLEGT